MELIYMLLLILVALIIINIWLSNGGSFHFFDEDMRRVRLWNLEKGWSDIVDGEPEQVGPNYHFKIPGLDDPVRIKTQELLFSDPRFPALNKTGERVFLHIPESLWNDPKIQIFGMNQLERIRRLEGKVRTLEDEKRELLEKAYDEYKTTTKPKIFDKKYLHYAKPDEDKRKYGGPGG